ncbi:MAG: hypothetical protein AUF68_03520 [Verrucomicrobia bacterium 13_1_20CM_54_28]|nr:MAG: hypothetical protein AUF68_03520 [Verrucomicrobia bacterium 13_1_20CM_54_28]
MKHNNNVDEIRLIFITYGVVAMRFDCNSLTVTRLLLLPPVFVRPINTGRNSFGPKQKAERSVRIVSTGRSERDSRASKSKLKRLLRAYRK